MAPRNLTTCHADPWALVRRAGDTEGKHLSTRMAYLTGTYVPKGQHQAAAFTGYVMNNDMTGWSKTKRRIEFADILKRWRKQPAPADVRKAKQKLPVCTPDTPLAAGNGKRAYFEATGQIDPVERSTVSPSQLQGGV